MTTPPLEELLTQHADALLGYVRRHAGRLLRYDSPEDLLQEIHVRALERGASFKYTGIEAFQGWMYKVARSLLADRHAHWSALRRRPAALLRLTFGVTPAPGGPAVGPPPDSDTGPATFAERRGQMDLAVKALGMLLPRDQDLIRWATEDVPIAEQAQRLGISHAAAERAGIRARERLRKSFRLLARGQR